MSYVLISWDGAYQHAVRMKYRSGVNAHYSNPDTVVKIIRGFYEMSWYVCHTEWGGYGTASFGGFCMDGNIYVENPSTGRIKRYDKFDYHILFECLSGSVKT